MFTNRSKNIIYFLILVIPFVFFFSRSEKFKSGKLKIAEIVSQPVRLLSFPIHELKKILYYHRIYNEYKKLEKETDLLKARLVGLEEVIKENTRLEQMLEFKRRLLYSAVSADVIGRNPSRWNSSILINKGSEDGIQEGMPVVNALGVVGKVAEVGRQKSKVILLTDPQFSVAGLMQHNREVGLVSGTLQELCRIRYINPDAKVSVGDVVITSKLSVSFPEGLMIGKVKEIIENPKTNSIECLVVPSVAVSQIEEVLVILK